MVRCCIKNCKSDSERKIRGLSFHRFPDSDVAKLWIAATRRVNWVPNDNSRICSLHFDEKYIRKRRDRTFLKHDAVPNMFTDIESKTNDIAQSILNTITDIANRKPDVSEETSSMFYDAETLDTLRTLQKKITEAKHQSEQRLKKLKALQEKSRRYQIRVAKLENVLTALKSKSLVSEEDPELLSWINTFN